MSQNGGTDRPSQGATEIVQSESSPWSFVYELIKPSGRRHHANDNNTNKNHVINNADSWVDARTGPNTHNGCPDKGCIDNEEWELVVIPKEDGDGTDISTDAISNHFDITIGWGQKKFTLLSWDLKYESQNVTRE
ncbi:hypothetical protein SAMD00023353_8000410 [Rosellinia necatrix]|uniref:Uncharacterized protein n=1 Tax=Rosellinia necatrix TaxID=77044 RepID=A0A1W2TUR2_ROSNE|nr:hypothetical protein SAMD00023353_8000410 [Rosellinia necatrix]